MRICIWRDRALSKHRSQVRVIGHTCEVLVCELPLQQVGDGLEAAVWMVGEASTLLGAALELVQQQERVQVPD